MKDYKRLTVRRSFGVIDNCANCPNINNKQGCTDKKCYEIMRNRLAALEDRIESGELISTKETGDTEIEFFVKHNQIVRKTVIKQFAKDLKEKEQSIKVGNEWVAIITDKDIDELLHKRYSIRLEEEADND